MRRPRPVRSANPASPFRHRLDVRSAKPASPFRHRPDGARLCRQLVDLVVACDRAARRVVVALVRLDPAVALQALVSVDRVPVASAVDLVVPAADPVALVALVVALAADPVVPPVAVVRQVQVVAGLPSDGRVASVAIWRSSARRR